MNDSIEKSSSANMDSYVVYIYRRDRQHPDKIIGIVETISTRKKDAFKDCIELMAILTQPS